MMTGGAQAQVVAGGADPADLWRQASLGDFAPLDRARVDGTTSEGAQCLIAAERAAIAHHTDDAVAEIECFRSTNDPNAASQETAAEVETAVRFAAGDYRQAAEAANRGAALAGRLGLRRQAADQLQTAMVASLLARAPKQSVSSGFAHAIPTARDAAGLPRVAAIIGGHSLDMIVDTGANLSVVSDTVARSLKLAMIGGDASVGSSSRASVSVRIGIAAKMQLGGITLANVAFLVLDDAALAPSPTADYKIDGILGFPVFQATSGFTMDDRTFTPAPPSRIGHRTPLRIVGNDLFVEAYAAGRYAPLHLDTGASDTTLSWLFAERYPDALRGSTHQLVRSGGAGGEIQRDAAALEMVDLALGGESFRLPKVDVQLTRDVSPAGFGVLGQDLLRQVAWYGLDLQKIQLMLGPRR